MYHRNIPHRDQPLYQDPHTASSAEAPFDVLLQIMMFPYLRFTDIIDCHHPTVQTQAAKLAAGTTDDTAVARACFTWVRDEVSHTRDAGEQAVTCTASDVLAAGTGFCYAKSHLLVALLRANGIPAGLCYQRLSRDGDGAPFCLHGLVGVYLQAFGWYRIDPRGNTPDIDAQFTPPVEQLAWPACLPGEANLPEIWPDPLPIVLTALYTYRTSDALVEHLPDVPLISTYQESRL